MPPLDLPFCVYPAAREVAATYTTLPLPTELPLVNLTAARPYRNQTYTAISADQLSLPQLWEMAQVVGTSFSKREPMSRHILPPHQPPIALHGAQHEDVFGRHSFGAWSRESLMHWFIRLFVLTDPTAPVTADGLNHLMRTQSMAIVGPDGRILGGAFNEPMPPIDVEMSLRDNDPFLEGVLSYVAPMLNLLGAQDAEGITSLCQQYPAFAQAYQQELVGHHFMIARGDDLPKVETFELFAATIERYRELGYHYVMVEATNQWTGSACELLGGVRVHYAAYRTEQTLPVSIHPLAESHSSPDGFLSYKDSGSMLYVLRLV